MFAPVPHRLGFGLGLGLLLLLPALPAWAAAPETPEQQYQSCIRMTQLEPSQAFETALAWHDRGGGLAADHCAALALIGLKQYEEAASRLETLAKALDKIGSPLTPDVLDQAANAWLLGNQPDRAIGNVTAALKLKPNSPDYLIDRARAYAVQHRYALAANDLDSAIALAPGRGDAYGFRASARRHLGDLKGALADANTAVVKDPDAVGAWLERGILHRELGNKAAARQDWVKVVELAPGTAAAAAAQGYLESMDMRAK